MSLEQFRWYFYQNTTLEVMTSSAIVSVILMIYEFKLALFLNESKFGVEAIAASYQVSQCVFLSFSALISEQFTWSSHMTIAEMYDHVQVSWLLFCLSGLQLLAHSVHRCGILHTGCMAFDVKIVCLMV